ncbi:amino acid ABC transporter substrate-binding protein [Spirosoma utsteinense]|uniref:amino acid ABC transporter substrate-binding protein n=1 Tax=Spirosoma utsteinense TaxID=2585773 RepID=UPI001EB3842C|nr:amino acid ABC transporter substrate-binding protein [Spirosoma utsteinense]MBC3789093.1 tetratricopeptide (TPR) repeat protein [Spirosoma utsteinense]
MNTTFRWYRLSLTGWLVVACFLTVNAQVSVEAQKRYKEAIRLIQTGSYDRAKNELNPIIQRTGPLAPYASYYVALADFRQKNFSQSRLMLKQLVTRFPNWQKIDDAQYLLAAVCMEMGEYEDGLAALKPIGTPALRTEGVKLEQNFMGRLTDLNRLKRINRDYPDDKPVALALIDLIQRTATDKDDLELSDRLTNRFGVPVSVAGRPVSPVSSGTTTSANRPTTRPNRAKGYYNVAVMFPFRLDEFDADKRGRSNQYAYDLYEGMKMARAKLQEEGITVNLFAYDVENDPNKTLELVNSPGFAQTDLIIGPLYVEPNRIASAFANQNNILLVNPIATGSELVASQPMSFLAQPSLNEQARRAAEQARSLIGGGARRVAIYFGTSRKDSLLAAAYQAELKQQNYQILDFKRLSGTAQAMAEAMRFDGKMTTVGSVSAVPTTPVPITVSHVFFASSNDDDGARMLDALSRRRVSAPLIATASAFDYYRNPMSTFTRRELYLLYPDYIDTMREPVMAFQEQYIAKRNTIPSVFAGEGYDMLLFFGRQMAKNGVPFRSRTALRTDPEGDYVLSGFDYTESNENQVVPIVKYEDGRFIKIN